MDIFEGNCLLDQALIIYKCCKNLSLLCIYKNRQHYNIIKKILKH